MDSQSQVGWSERCSFAGTPHLVGRREPPQPKIAVRAGANKGRFRVTHLPGDELALLVRQLP